MKRTFVVLVMIAASVFIANPAFADNVDPSTATASTSQSDPPAEPAPAADPPAEATPAADSAPAPAPAAEPASDPADAATGTTSDEPPATVGTPTAPLAADAPAAPKAALSSSAPAAAAKDAVVPAGKVVVCHANSSDTTPYRYILVDDNSARLKAHLNHRDSPNKTWKTTGTFNGVDHVAGQAKPDRIGPTEAEPNNPAISEADCVGTTVPAPPVVAQEPIVIQPTCTTGGSITLPIDLVIDLKTVIEYSFVTGSADMTSGAYDVLAKVVDDDYTFADDNDEIHFTGELVAATNCPVAATVPDVQITQNCAGGDVPTLPTTQGVSYAFTQGDGVSGPWEVTATALPNWTLDGPHVFTGDAKDPSTCGSVTPIPGPDPVTPAQVTPAGVTNPTAVSSTALPNTGGVSSDLVLLGAMLMLAGTLMVARGRRKA